MALRSRVHALFIEGRSSASSRGIVGMMREQPPIWLLVSPWAFGTSPPARLTRLETKDLTVLPRNEIDAAITGKLER